MAFVSGSAAASSVQIGTLKELTDQSAEFQKAITEYGAANSSTEGKVEQTATRAVVPVDASKSGEQVADGKSKNSEGRETGALQLQSARSPQIPIVKQPQFTDQMIGISWAHAAHS